ncbi:MULTISPECIES: hypothetical protein [Acinetobacter]|nr:MULTISPECIES: hypothetical protein [Acinetobacter]MDV4273941.1 hypothetical protein [Acinetobacter baumannii]MEB3797111.1 hypothetical protein [Acinetobacter sp. IK24]MEB3816239.1 hypothetical protein [Acinetobacter sp. IK22]MEB3835475.1 hypothetical protein [Acinetobacter sp. IK23]MEB3839147.1 hypothetical protein [Acinetobacter sp. IK25]
MTIENLCKQYLDGLNQGNIDLVLSLFERDATISSPLYGNKPVKTFYDELFADTSLSETTLLHISKESDEQDAIALHFNGFVAQTYL